MKIIITFQNKEEIGVIDNASHGPATRWRMREATTSVFGFRPQLWRRRREFPPLPPRVPDDIGS